jgi:Inner membrane protein YgaP-like, transmembrane domain
MKKNMGTADKVIRVIIAIIIALLFYFKVVTGTLGIVLIIVSGIFVLTSFISFCPLYTIFGFNTCPAKKS